MRILGIDPGTGTVGYGAIDVQNGTFESVAYGVIHTHSKDPMPFRLQMIFQDMHTLLQDIQPDVVAVEQLFFFKNAKTVITVAQARGVILLSLENDKVAIVEYTPLQVKQSITGYGRAEKRELQEMVMNLLNLSEIPKPDDAADALAIAICHAHHIGM